MIYQRFKENKVESITPARARWIWSGSFSLSERRARGASSNSKSSLPVVSVVSNGIVTGGAKAGRLGEPLSATKPKMQTQTTVAATRPIVKGLRHRRHRLAFSGCSRSSACQPGLIWQWVSGNKLHSILRCTSTVVLTSNASVLVSIVLQAVVYVCPLSTCNLSSLQHRFGMMPDGSISNICSSHPIKDTMSVQGVLQVREHENSGDNSKIIT